MRRHTPPPPGGPRTAPEGDTQIWPRPSTSILGPPTASALSRPGPTSPLTRTSEPTCSGSAHVSALAPYGRPRVALFGRPLTECCCRVPRRRDRSNVPMRPKVASEKLQLGPSGPDRALQLRRPTEVQPGRGALRAG